MPQTPKPVIGLLGGPGSGKSLVAQQLASLQCAVIDADALARQLLQQQDIIDQIVDWWGPAILSTTGQIDRRQLAGTVFSAPDKLKRLEALLHPRVHLQRQALRQNALNNPDTLAIVEDCPLLLELGIDQQCDALIFVDAPFQTRLQRVQQTRGWGPDDLAQRDKNQTPLDIKRKRADYVISNDADEARCLEQTRSVLTQIIQ
jgi:dephospho-CoA kinase